MNDKYKKQVALLIKIMPNTSREGNELDRSFLGKLKELIEKKTD
jgi:hypothetical protein